MNMQRIFKFSLAVGESFQFISQRSLSTSKCRHVLRKNPARYLQDIDVGQQALRLCAVHTLLDEHPSLTAEQVNDVANGFVYDDFLLKIKDSPLLSPLLGQNCVEEGRDVVKDILSKIGELKRNEDESTLEGLLDEIKKTCIVPLSSSETNTLIKSQHSRFFLRRFCDAENINVSVSDEGVVEGEHNVSIVIGRRTAGTAKDTVQYDAVSKACLAALKSKFAEQFDAVDMNDFPDLPLEKQMDIGNRNDQRFINVSKSSEEELGITIRGGQQKIIKNKEYLQVTIITPIFISDVKEHSPADKAGLRMGDVLLGVNDYSFKKKTHEQVLLVMTKVVQQRELNFSVLYDKKVMMKYQLERKLLARELKYVKKEMRANNALSEWHAAKSKVDPMEYFMEQFVEPKGRTHHWQKGGRFQRLWHQYKPVRSEPRGRIDTRKRDQYGDLKKIEKD